MNKTIKKIALLGMFIFSAPQALGAVITNGNFSDSCNLSGWNQDTDGFGDTGNADFAINGSAPGCTADVNVGDWSTSPAFVGNTLSQTLDLTGADDSTFLLSMDFSVDSMLTSIDPDFFADILTINLTGTAGFPDIMFETQIDGFADYSLDFVLDSSFANDEFWDLEFVMLDGFDSFGSTLSIRNVSLTEMLAPVNDVPEPTSLAIFALGFAGLIARRKHANELIRESINK